ncbi:peptidylprolyl isomerase [Sphingomonas jejuensis]|uniref:Peptidylprolyl isomerase n=1 Tax=Sphingomonas jejuensis TaxID=904715 RepID=A0ABX0XMT4_9SPHN|nr:peptidylprolyl isomerase [Sphingomonas jejuensis]NJC34585.1 peptidylprolyl isomerase [Sphingomonas jejuensis]
MLALLLAALQAAAPSPGPAPSPQSPSQIAAEAPAAEWVDITPNDLLVMELAPAATGRPRRIVIQLVPPPFSAPWVANIRTLARARWWDGTSVNRVQDNYVAQWGDATEAKPLPDGLLTGTEAGYTTQLDQQDSVVAGHVEHTLTPPITALRRADGGLEVDPYARGGVGFVGGFPVGNEGYGSPDTWPLHCYGAVGVGRNLSPDTGYGAELYAVIGHAPRHLDRNIAVVGRVIEGIEHLSSLPRGTGALGFYERPEERVAIRSIRLGSDLPAADRPRLQYLAEGGATMTRFIAARQNREPPFFIRPAGGADICNVPVPVRAAP